MFQRERQLEKKRWPERNPNLSMFKYALNSSIVIYVPHASDTTFRGCNIHLKSISGVILKLLWPSLTSENVQFTWRMAYPAQKQIPMTIAQP